MTERASSNWKVVDKQSEREQISCGLQVAHDIAERWLHGPGELPFERLNQLDSDVAARPAHHPGSKAANK